MKWSWKIGTFAGIGVYVHATFLLLLGWIALSHWMQYQSLIPTLTGVVFILALFLCVVLHEYGHALTARRFGIATKVRVTSSTSRPSRVGLIDEGKFWIRQRPRDP